MEEFNTSQSQPGEADVTSTEDKGADSQNAVDLKDLLGKELGKEFPDNETALKSVKDTFKYVGKVGKVAPLVEKLQAKYGGEAQVLKLMEDLANQETPQQDLAKKVESLEQTLKETGFYSEHPELKPYKELIATLGNDPAKVVESPVFKETYSKLKAHDEATNTKSVLHSNARIGQVTDKMSEAQAAIKAGDQGKAESSAVSAVMEAFDIK